MTSHDETIALYADAVDINLFIGDSFFGIAFKPYFRLMHIGLDC
jgi:hypothetical protein